MMGLLVWSVFHRLTFASRRTRFDVRVSITAMGGACMIGIGAPFYGWMPDFVTLVITFAITLMQVTFARHWNNGTPLPFLDPDYYPKRRAEDFKHTGIYE